MGIFRTPHQSVVSWPTNRSGQVGRLPSAHGFHPDRQGDRPGDFPYLRKIREETFMRTGQRYTVPALWLRRKHSVGHSNRSAGQNAKPYAGKEVGVVTLTDGKFTCVAFHSGKGAARSHNGPAVGPGEASFGEASLWAVGLESGKIMGRLVCCAISWTILLEKALGWVEVPIKMAGWTARTVSARPTGFLEAQLEIFSQGWGVDQLFGLDWLPPSVNQSLTIHQPNFLLGFRQSIAFH